MNKNSKLATSFIVVVICLALAVSSALAGPGPAGEQPPNQGQERPYGPWQHGRGDEVAPDPVNPPVNPPQGGQPATNFVADGTTALVVVVWGDLDGDAIWDPEEVALEGVYVALETAKGLSVRPGIKTDVFGQVSFLNLVAGEYMVVVLPVDNFQSAKVSATVVAGQTTVIEVGLKPASTGG